MCTASSLCKCICGSSKTAEALQTHSAFSLSRLTREGSRTGQAADAPITRPASILGRLCFSVLPDQTLRGKPIRQGSLWLLSDEDTVDEVQVSLYVNGFMFRKEEREACVCLGPFSLVRNCKFQTSAVSAKIAELKIFKVALFTSGASYFFGVLDPDEAKSEEERSQWVTDLSYVVRAVTQSLFPPVEISCAPLRNVMGTQTRLMASFLIRHDDVAVCSVLYCELHAPREERAQLVMYQNELCEVRVAEVWITESSVCCEKVGINCSCFSLEDQLLSCRSVAERKLWLRAISNVKVRLQNRAPNPTLEDIGHFREAIKDHLSSIQPQLEGLADWGSIDPLLQKMVKRPAHGTGVWTPVSSPKGMAMSRVAKECRLPASLAGDSALDRDAPLPDDDVTWTE